MPCDKLHCTCKNEIKSTCVHWTPGRTSKYFRCSRFITARVTCDLHRSACATCPLFIKEFPKRDPQHNWNDADAIKKWRNEYMRRYRAKKKAEGKA